MTAMIPRKPASATISRLRPSIARWKPMPTWGTQGRKTSASQGPLRVGAACPKDLTHIDTTSARSTARASSDTQRGQSRFHLPEIQASSAPMAGTTRIHTSIM